MLKFDHVSKIKCGEPYVHQILAHSVGYTKVLLVALAALLTENTFHRRIRKLLNYLPFLRSVYIFELILKHMG